MYLKIVNETDRVMVSGILVKNGYTVRETKIKDPKTGRTRTVIEATEQEANNG